MILSQMDTDIDETLNNITVDTYKEENTELNSANIESAPVVNFVNRVLLDAIEKGASDIHFEHYERAYRIRFRQYGVLYPVNAPPLKLANF